MMAAGEEAPQSLERDGIFVSLTHAPLDISSALNSVRSPEAGAVVLFIGIVSEPYSLTRFQRLISILTQEQPVIVWMESLSSSFNTQHMFRRLFEAYHRLPRT